VQAGQGFSRRDQFFPPAVWPFCRASRKTSALTMRPAVVDQIDLFRLGWSLAPARLYRGRHGHDPASRRADVGSMDSPRCCLFTVNNEEDAARHGGLPLEALLSVDHGVLDPAANGTLPEPPQLRRIHLGRTACRERRPLASIVGLLRFVTRGVDGTWFGDMPRESSASSAEHCSMVNPKRRHAASSPARVSVHTSLADGAFAQRIGASPNPCVWAAVHA